MKITGPARRRAYTTVPFALGAIAAALPLCAWAQEPPAEPAAVGSLDTAGAQKKVDEVLLARAA